MISSIVHTYNEEDNIDRCLSSLSFTDETVVVDMGSSDRTLEKAKNYNTRIFKHHYTGFVEPARNFAISKAKGDWILIVDADEEVKAKFAGKIKSILNNREFDYYRIPRKNIIFGKWIRHCGWWPDFQVRLFRKGYVEWTEKIHGVPITKGRGCDLEAKEENALIHHNYQNIEEYIERLNRYTSITAKELYMGDGKFSLDQLVNIPTREFVSRFFLKKGYLDGLHGLSLSLLQTISEYTVLLKLWEHEKFRSGNISLAEIEKQMEKTEKTIRYWLLSEKLSLPHNFIQDIIWRIKRKI